MTQRCDNCGRPLLKSDTLCFHCHTPVPNRGGELAAPEHPGLNWRALAAHGSLLAGLLVLGMFLMNWMGAGFRSQQEATPMPPAPAGWRVVTAESGDYRLWLPDDWQVVTPENPDWQAILDAARQPVPESFRRVEPAKLEERASLLGQSPVPAGATPMRVLVQLHPGLANYNLAVLEAEDWFARGMVIDSSGGSSVVLRPSGDAALITELVYPAGGGLDLYTVTMLVKSARGIYGITVSADADTFIKQEDTLWDILESFFLLS